MTWLGIRPSTFASAALFAVATARIADAQPDPLAPSTIQTTPGCSSARELRERFATTDDAVRFDVRIERAAPSGYRGHIRVRHVGDDLISERSFDAATCEEIVEALTLVASLSTDTHDSDDTQKPAVRKAYGTLDSGPRYQLAFPREPVLAKPHLPDPAFVVGAQTGISSGTGPRLMTTLGGFVALERRSVGSARLSAWMSPTAAWRTPGVPGAAAKVEGYGFSLEGCPRPAIELGLVWTACLRVELQHASARGYDIGETRRSDIWWLGLSIPLRVRLLLNRTFFFEVEGAPRLALGRGDLVLFPFDDTAFRNPLFGFTATTSVGYAWR